MWYSENWKDYELLDATDGERLERWGKYILVRPDPQIIWRGAGTHALWKKADAVYRRSSAGGGGWKQNRLPEQWHIQYGELKFLIKPMGFKHTGLFPEQAANWDWFSEKIRKAGRPIKVLNLFAYTGGATVAAAKAGAAVVHVDAAKNMVAQAKENARLSGLSEAPIRISWTIARSLWSVRSSAATSMTPSSWIPPPTAEVPRARSGRSRTAWTSWSPLPPRSFPRSPSFS